MTFCMAMTVYFSRVARVLYNCYFCLVAGGGGGVPQKMIEGMSSGLACVLYILFVLFSTDRVSYTC